ncbi:MAG TPA: type II toxin-antitoxin system PemK/MazF family toxin, partial [Dehalococcoidia bacterium]
MSVKRGDVILTYVPNVGSPGGKVRPALIVQSDYNNARLNETIIAAITSNTLRVHEATQLLIEVATPDGAASGLLHDSAVRCERLHSIPQTDVRRVIGRLSDALMQQIDDCLKA